MPLHPRKRFGQNFLRDENILAAMVKAISPKAEDCMVEIGPGMGALTFHLLPKLNVLTAVEIDRDAVRYLRDKGRGNDKLVIVEGDALVFDFGALTGEGHLRIVGNLPYNISTPLLFHLLEFQPQIQDMHFLLQKEVAERLTAVTKTKSYGRLSVMMQYFFEIERFFDVPPSAFWPRPKVDSSFMRFIPRASSSLTCLDMNRLDEILRAAFSQRRKTLKNSLGAYFSEQELLQLDVDSRRRAETLSVEDFVRLANALAEKS